MTTQGKKCMMNKTIFKPGLLCVSMKLPFTVSWPWDMMNCAYNGKWWDQLLKRRGITV